MPQLAEVQTALRRAVVSAELSAAAPYLTAPVDPLRRLEIHRRHYEASLVEVLLARHPACVWLLGSAFVVAAARDFVRLSPPRSPVIAEYGWEFGTFLANRPGASQLPYLASFAEVELHLGHVSVAVDETPLDIAALATVGHDTLLDAVVTFQPGVRYLETQWPVDRIFEIYLADQEQAQLSFEPAPTWLEIRGARGRFGFERIWRGTYCFRRMLARSQTVAVAAEAALALEPELDPGAELVAMFRQGLVTRMDFEGKERFHVHD